MAVWFPGHWSLRSSLHIEMVRKDHRHHHIMHWRAVIPGDAISALLLGWQDGAGRERDPASRLPSFLRGTLFNSYRSITPTRTFCWVKSKQIFGWGCVLIGSTEAPTFAAFSDAQKFNHRWRELSVSKQAWPNFATYLRPCLPSSPAFRKVDFRISFTGLQGRLFPESLLINTVTLPIFKSNLAAIPPFP